MAILSICAFLIFVPLAGCAAQPMSFASPEDAAHVLETCTADTCSQLSASLHLEIPLRPKVCSVGIFHGSFEPDSDDALLKIQCSMDVELILLTRKSRGRWQYSDSMPFPVGAYDVITVGLQKLIDLSNDDLVIHGDTVAYGTGIYQADFLVVQVSQRKLRVVLDAVEKGREYPPESGGGPNQWLEQQSSFETTVATKKGRAALRRQ